MSDALTNLGASPVGIALGLVAVVVLVRHAYRSGERAW